MIKYKQITKKSFKTKRAFIDNSSKERKLQKR